MRIFIAALVAASVATGAFANRPDAAQPPLAPMVQLLALGKGAVVTADACCKRCSKGKACGDSCISRSKTCHEGQGCACD